MRLVGISAVSFECADGWAPLAQVAVEENGLVDIHRIEPSDTGLRLRSREEANTFAIELARAWASRAFPDHQRTG